MAMQRPLPFGSMTVLENALLGAMFGVGEGVLSEREARRRAAEALAFVGLDERADQPVSSLNLHQQRFLEMAKALAGRPRCSARRGDGGPQRGGARRLRRDRPERPRQLGTAILWVEHVMSAVIQLAERAIVLNFGKVLAEGRQGSSCVTRRRRRLPREGPRCLRSTGLAAGYLGERVIEGIDVEVGTVRRSRSSARTARGRRRSSGPSPGCFRRWRAGSSSTGRT